MRIFLVIAISLGIAGAGLYWLLVESKAIHFEKTIRPAIRTVLVRKLQAELTGGYWENEMIKQHSECVSRLGKKERLQYYLAMILYGDLDTSAALEFNRIVGHDAAGLAAFLKSIPHDDAFAWVGEGRKLERIEGRSDVIEHIAKHGY